MTDLKRALLLFPCFLLIDFLLFTNPQKDYGIQNTLKLFLIYKE